MQYDIWIQKKKIQHENIVHILSETCLHLWIFFISQYLLVCLCIYLLQREWLWGFVFFCFLFFAFYTVFRCLSCLMFLYGFIIALRVKGKEVFVFHFNGSSTLLLLLLNRFECTIALNKSSLVLLSSCLQVKWWMRMYYSVCVQMCSGADVCMGMGSTLWGLGKHARVLTPPGCHFLCWPFK